MWKVQDMIVMRVSHEAEVCLRDMHIDGRNIRCCDIIPSVYLTRVFRRSCIGWRKWWWRPKDSREIGIDQNHGGSVADPPPSRPNIFEGDLTAFFGACTVLSCHGTSDSEAETENR